jgi:predicted negative regulator of RcsB-dependent stress response
MTQQQQQPQQKVSLKVLDGQTEFVEDELQRLGEFFNKLSKPLFYILIIAAIGFFGHKFYSEAKLKSAKEGAVQLELVRNTYSELLKAVESKNPDEIAKLNTKFNEQLKTLSDKPKPYQDYGRVYALLSAKARGDQADIEKIISDPVTVMMIQNPNESLANKILADAVARISPQLK